MILAAGRGERMRPLTDTTPKPLLEVRGRPLIEYHLEGLRGSGIREVVINLSWLGDKIRGALGDGSKWGLAIHYCDEGPEPFETAGGIFNALPFLGAGPFMVVNGDVYTDYAFSRLSLAAGDTGHLVLVPNPPQHPRGDFGLASGRVTRPGGKTYTFSGVALYRPEFFAGCAPGRFPLLPLLQRAIDAGSLTGELHPGVWSDVGTPERLALLQSGKIA